MNISTITFYGLIFGMLGTTLGGFIGAILKVSSNRLLSFVLEFSAGLMTAIICFDLIPNSLEYSSINLCLLGIFFGLILMILCDELTNKLEFMKVNFKNNDLFKTGILTFIGLTIHNLPERFSNRLWL